MFGPQHTDLMCTSNRQNFFLNYPGRLLPVCIIRCTVKKHEGQMAHKQRSFSKAMNRAAKTYGKPEGYDYKRDTLYANDSCYDDGDGYDDYLKLMQEAQKTNGRKPAGYDYKRDTLYAEEQLFDDDYETAEPTGDGCPDGYDYKRDTLYAND